MQISIAVPRTVEDARILVEATEFRAFDEIDQLTFEGIEAEGALIGEFGDYGTIIVDSERIVFIDHDEMEEVHLVDGQIIQII
jgi:hypothetical protein